jgi:hypothetical protein
MAKRKKRSPLQSTWRAPFPDLSCDKPGLAPVSNKFANPSPKKDMHEHKWKKGKEETPATVAETEANHGKVAVVVNKGAYQMMLPSEVKHLGKK